MIDTLRGLSIVFVVMRHIDIRIPFKNVPWANELPETWLRLFLSGGGYGVRIFFVISGFLITSNTLLRWNRLDLIDVRAFYQLRFARIFPLFFALLVVASGLHLAGVPGYVILPERASLGEAWWAALGLHVNWLEYQRGYLPASWDVLWTLSIEEVFYLVFPWVCLASRRKAVFVTVALVLVGLGPLARTWTSHEYWQSKSYLACMDGIAIGALAALWNARLARQRQVARVRRALLWAGGLVGAAVLGVFGVRVQLGAAWTSTVLALATAALLLGQAHWRGIGWMNALGRSSYEIYLTHMFVVLAGVSWVKTRGIGPEWTPMVYGALIVGAWILGEAVRRFFSDPINRRLRRRFGQA